MYRIVESNPVYSLVAKRLDEPNSNGHILTSEEAQKAIDKIKGQIKENRMFGVFAEFETNLTEGEFPDASNINMAAASIQITDVRIENYLLWVDFKTLDTRGGRFIAEMMEVPSLRTQLRCVPIAVCRGLLDGCELAGVEIHGFHIVLANDSLKSSQAILSESECISRSNALTMQNTPGEFGLFSVSGADLVACVIQTAMTCREYPMLPRDVHIIADEVTKLYKSQFRNPINNLYTRDFSGYDDLHKWIKENILPIQKIREMNLSQSEFDAGIDVKNRGSFVAVGRGFPAIPEDDDFVDLDAFARNLVHNIIRSNIHIDFSTFK